MILLTVGLAVSLLASLVWYFIVVKRGKARMAIRRDRRLSSTTTSTCLQSRKPDWVRREVLRLHEQTSLSHRKLAQLFNQHHFAATGMSVGRTFVRDLLSAHAHQALLRQVALKHNIPEPVPANAMWGIDGTCVRDTAGRQHILLGIIDYGSRLNLALRRVRRFNCWTLLGTIFLAVGEFGPPAALKMDNHPVHRSRRFRALMRWAAIGLRFTRFASPWQNGRIERFFGTLKQHLAQYPIDDAQHLVRAMAEFQYFYNVVRPHQHLNGMTPAQAWNGVDPFRQAPKEKIWFNQWGGRLRGWVLRH